MFRKYCYKFLVLAGLLSFNTSPVSADQGPIFGVTGFLNPNSNPCSDCSFIELQQQEMKFGYTTAFNGRYLFIGAPNFSSADSQNTGYVNVYYLDENENWILTQTLTTLGGWDTFGLSLKTEGDYLFVSGIGTPLLDQGTNRCDQNYTGSVLIYKISGDLIPETNASEWKKFQELNANSVLPIVLTSGATDPNPQNIGASFGYSLDVDIKHGALLIGAPQQVTGDPVLGNTLGAVFAFHLSGRTGFWEFRQMLLPPDPSDTFRFGYNIALDEGYSLIRSSNYPLASNNNTSTVSNGIVYAFRFVKSSLTWQYTQTLLGDETAAQAINAGKGDNFGAQLSVDKKHALITASSEINGSDTPGAAYFYIRNGHQWIKSQKFLNPDRFQPSNFGFSVGQIVGSYALISSTNQSRTDSTTPGAFILYERNKFGAWKQVLTLFNPPGQNGDLFGSGGTLTPFEFINGRLRMMIAGTTPITGVVPGVSIFTTFP